MGEMNLIERLRHALATEPMSRADDITRLLTAIETLTREVEDAAKSLDAIKYDLEASVYTLTDDEFETTFFVRDELQTALDRVRGLLK